MKYIFIYLISLVVTTTTVYAQQIENRRKFDIRKYNENTVNDRVYTYQSNDTTVVNLSFWGTYYLETQIFNGSQRENRYAYDLNGKIKSSSEYYAGVPIGKTKIFNTDGDIVKEVDEDAPYLFSMEDLRKLIVEIFDIDILYPKRGYHHKIDRFQNGAYNDQSLYPTANYIYDVDVMVNKNKLYSVPHHLIINAETGEILSHIDENGNELASKYKKDTSMNTQRNWTPLMD